MRGNKGAGIWTGLVMAIGFGTAQADSVQHWKSASDAMAMGLPALALGLTLRHNDTEGVGQLALSLGSTVVATETLKRTVHARRPDGSANQSFPSGHTAVAFSAAAYLERRYGEAYGAFVPALYGVAALTGLSRVQANKHRWVDVLSGAALGYGASRLWSSPVQGGHLSVLPAPEGLAVGWARTF